MQVLVASARLAFAIVLSFLVANIASAQQPVEIETDAGVVTTVATVEAIDATRQVVTLVGPHNNWVVVRARAP